MKISAHTNITNPETCGYPYLESIESYANLCDEVVVVDGGTTDNSLKKIEELNKKLGGKIKVIKGEKWERDFDWYIMPKNLNIGYEACEHDWAFHFDVDYIFHEKDVVNMRLELEKAHLPAIELKKTNFVLSYETFVKDYYPLLVNKGQNPAIRYGVAEDNKGRKSATFLRPIVKKGQYKNGVYYGEVVKMTTTRVQRVHFGLYCYDFTFMTREQIIEQRVRFENSLSDYLGQKRVSERVVIKKFDNMMKYRHGICKDKERVKLEEHSKFIREKVKNITIDMFGYNMWGLLPKEHGK